ARGVGRVRPLVPADTPPRGLKGKCERGDLNPTPDRENPAFSRIATVKDRRRPSRIVPDRHNLGGAGEEVRGPRGAKEVRASVADWRSTLSALGLAAEELAEQCGIVRDAEDRARLEA